MSSHDVIFILVRVTRLTKFTKQYCLCVLNEILYLATCVTSIQHDTGGTKSMLWFVILVVGSCCLLSRSCSILLLCVLGVRDSLPYHPSIHPLLPSLLLHQKQGSQNKIKR